MLITKKSTLTGKVSSMEIPVTKEQIIVWQNGALIQNVMPNLSVDEREFLISGITPDDWDRFFKHA